LSSCSRNLAMFDDYSPQIHLILENRSRSFVMLFAFEKKT
jgi:hypothetical protein